MPRLRLPLILLLVLTLTGGCTMLGVVTQPSPGPSGASGAVPTGTPSTITEPSLPVRPTPSAAPATPTTAPTAEPTFTPQPSATVRPPLAVRLLGVGSRGPADAPDADVARLVRGSTDFALDLLARVISGSDEPNVVLGPSSISAAFALLHAGARGETATQIEQTMGFDLPPFRLNAAYNALDQALRSRENRKVTLNVVNQLFGQDGYPFGEAFLRTASRQYGAPLAAVDFGRKAANVTRVINRWIADQTNGRITDVIQPGQLDAATRLVLANATYLKAEWDQQFEATFTAPRPFMRPDGSKVRVPMMFQSATFPAAFTDTYTAIELPYVGQELAMLIVMPDDPKAFLAGLDADGLDAIVAGLKTRFRVEGYPFEYVELSMPRFSARTTVALKPLLQKLGMRAVWQPGVADLTGIADPADTGEAALNASSATHQAWVKVTEKGTEAAAVTLIDVGTGGGPPVPPPQVTLDQPFLWFIRDRATGAVLFAGQVTDPSVTAD